MAEESRGVSASTRSFLAATAMEAGVEMKKERESHEVATADEGAEVLATSATTEIAREATSNEETATDSSNELDFPATTAAVTASDDEKTQILIQHDSMVTVRLSEPQPLPPTLTVDTNILRRYNSSSVARRSTTSANHQSTILKSGIDDAALKPSDLTTTTDAELESESELENLPASPSSTTASSPIVMDPKNSESGASLKEELEDSDDQEDDVQTPVDEASDTEEQEWEQLQKSPEQSGAMEAREPPATKSEADNDQSTALLLARLEQENNRIATNPKSVRARLSSTIMQPPPLRSPQPGKMMPLIRYSQLPAAAPMTDLEFYAALVKDYPSTAARLPTLLTAKVRKGVPPPLRGVVWQSMSGVNRDLALAETYDRLLAGADNGAGSVPYEGIIARDLGRSFPGVDMFRDPDGDGQRMLGRVLRCFSLYDPRIGYCQGLAFLVGPLLIHMPDRQAFCVLVRLMEHYDLRSCFLPDLAGLHVRIYQFRELLRQHLPTLSAHLDDLQVDPAYVSQWFLSFFAVTCPLPMLFRIYDVALAEGAAETLMRVALSLMHKNEGRLLACTELDEVMQLLLSRGIWDCYHYNADQFVQDFVSLSDVVTRESLQALELAFGEQQQQMQAVVGGSAASSSPSNPNSSTIIASANAATRTSEVTTAASRFLGRLWSSSNSTSGGANSIITTNTASSTILSSTTSTITSLSTPRTAHNLSPGLNPPPHSSTSSLSRPLSMLRRSASKQSLASTLNSMEAGSAVSLFSAASTDATTVSRDSSSNTSDYSSPTQTNKYNNNTGGGAVAGRGGNNGNGVGNSDSRYLHSQIEDLLTALSELQRNHLLLASQLQREKEEREEDGKAVRALVDGLRKKKTESESSKATSSTIKATSTVGSRVQLIDSSNVSRTATPSSKPAATAADLLGSEELSKLLEAVEQRFGVGSSDASSSASGGNGGLSSSQQHTRAELHDELSRARDQLVTESSRATDLSRRVTEAEQEAASLREQLRESHNHVRTLHSDKQRLERQIHDMRARASADGSGSGGGAGTDGTEWFSSVAASMTKGPVPSAGGLREFKLGRSKSTPTSQAVGVTSSVGAMSAALSRRTSSLIRGGNDGGPSFLNLAASTAPPANEHEALLLELVQAKTAEAVARQEAEEAKAKLESLRRQYGLTSAAAADNNHHQSQMLSSTAASAAQAAMGVLGRFTGSVTEAGAAGVAADKGATTNTVAASAGQFAPQSSVATTASSATASAAAAVSSFWGGWRKG